MAHRHSPQNTTATSILCTPNRNSDLGTKLESLERRTIDDRLIDRPTAKSVGLTYHRLIIIKINDFGLEMYVWFFNCNRFEFNI